MSVAEAWDANDANGQPAMDVPLHWTPDGLPLGSRPRSTRLAAYSATSCVSTSSR